MIEYVPDFLTTEEHDALFQACDQLPFTTNKTRWGQESRHSTITFGPDGFKMRSGYHGEYILFENAPAAIKMLQTKISAYAGKQVDYFSAVRYLDGDGGMNWHQHNEDRHGQDASVWIVRTGTERTLSTRPKGEKGRGAATHLLMKRGSLAVLPSSYNDTHEHAVLNYKGAGLCYSINAKVLPVHRPRVYDCHAGKDFPADAVYVGCRTERGGKVIKEGTIWGNGTNPLHSHDGKLGIGYFREFATEMMTEPDFHAQTIEALRGRDLLCWCNQATEGDHCHARVWLGLANQ